MNELQNMDTGHESAVAQRTAELEKEFSYDGYQVVRKELFAHLRDPAIVIRKDSVTFNTACINGLEDVVYIHILPAVSVCVWATQRSAPLSPVTVWASLWVCWLRLAVPRSA